MLEIDFFAIQNHFLPLVGAYIIGQYNKNSIIVYKAFNKSMARYILRHQKLGGKNFNFGRMIWFNLSFLWLMYKTHWATCIDREYILAFRITRKHFENILLQAVHSVYLPDFYKNHADWKMKLKNSGVRLQWGPDRDPYANKLARKTIQIGLKGKF